MDFECLNPEAKVISVELGGGGGRVCVTQSPGESRHNGAIG